MNVEDPTPAVRKLLRDAGVLLADVRHEADSQGATYVAGPLMLSAVGEVMTVLGEAARLAAVARGEVRGDLRRLRRRDTH